MKAVDFAEELNLVLPADLPNRETVVRKAAEHLELIVAVNQHLNLTRITTPREAAIKHVLDSVMPWRLFAGAKHVLDAGTGAGFPGIPLALVLPDVRFTLAESTQKKARFVESALALLDLPNVTISASRAEDLAGKDLASKDLAGKDLPRKDLARKDLAGKDLARQGAIDLITARALAPIPKVLELLGPALKTRARALLYKGPDAEQEIASAQKELKKFHMQAQVVMRYELPDALGTRSIVEIRM